LPSIKDQMFTLVEYCYMKWLPAEFHLLERHRLKLPINM
jgi:hypothetical protein